MESENGRALAVVGRGPRLARDPQGCGAVREITRM